MSLDLVFTDADVNFTYDWWTGLCEDETKMNVWLQKLQFTELQGYQDNIDAAEKYGSDNQRVDKLLRNTALDELRHSHLLSDVLNGRGLNHLSSHVSYFWDKLDAYVVDLATLCAVFYLGEALAAFRFEVIKHHPSTPDDVLHFINEALPDEEYHARGFRMHTTDEALSTIRLVYDDVVAKMKKT